jgi:flagellar basal body-associated protein FliL
MIEIIIGLVVVIFSVVILALFTWAVRKFVKHLEQNGFFE